MADLFPAYAGVILLSLLWLYASSSFPRICGGDPDIEMEQIRREIFSPHMRG